MHDVTLYLSYVMMPGRRCLQVRGPDKGGSTVACIIKCILYMSRMTLCMNGNTINIISMAKVAIIYKTSQSYTVAQKDTCRSINLQLVVGHSNHSPSSNIRTLTIDSRWLDIQTTHHRATYAL